MSVYRKAYHALPSHAAHQVGGAHAGAARPAVEGDETVAGVHGDHDRLWAERVAHGGDGVGVAHGGGAGQHAVHAEVEGGARGVEGAYAAAELHGHGGGGGGDGPDGGQVRGRAALGAVQVDDVESGRAGLDPAGGDLGGGVRVHGLAGVVALVEADASAAAQVYRGDDFHDAYSTWFLASATKLRYSLRPTSPLFSGWNWMANTLRQAAALQKSTP